jgi:prepilin-type N-terminal cleavage/methylation domain-containing protein
MLVNKHKKGFSLVEIMVVLSIFVILAMIVGEIFIQMLRIEKNIRDQISVADQARSVLNKMINELRQAKTADNGTYLLEYATSSEIIFYSNIDSDEAVERVRYFKDGNDFKKGVIKPVGNPAEYILADENIIVASQFVSNSESEPIFSFLKEGNIQVIDTLSEIQNISLIKAFLHINTDPLINPKDFIVSVSVRIRNKASLN